MFLKVHQNFAKCFLLSSINLKFDISRSCADEAKPASNSYLASSARLPGNLSVLQLLLNQISLDLNLRLLAITDTELKLMARAASIGLNKIPNVG